MRAVPEQIRPWVPNTYVTLGTDGFGFSDTRPAARRYYNTDGESVVVAVLEAAVVSVEAAGKVVVTASEPGVTTDVLLDPLAPDPQAASESTRSKTEPATVIFSRALLTIPPVSANAWAAWGAAHAS